MIVSLVRHGVTEWNKVHRYQGQTDVPLSDDGRSQAKRLAERFQSMEINGWVSSDLSRAAETADIVASHHSGVTIRRDSAWRELALGDLEGEMATDVKRNHPELMAAWLEAPSQIAMPNGESLVELQERIWKAFNALEFPRDEGHIVVFSHGFAILSLLCRVLEMDLDAFRRLWIDPTGVSRLEYQRGAWLVRSVNDTSHLLGE